MRLSEMSADKAFDVVVELTPHISSILENKEVKKLLKKIEVTEKDKENLAEKGFDETLKKVKPFMNLIFKESKEAIFNIVAIMNDLSFEEVRKMNFMKFNEVMMETFYDKALIELFTQRIGLKLKM